MDSTDEDAPGSSNSDTPKSNEENHFKIPNSPAVINNARRMLMLKICNFLSRESRSQRFTETEQNVVKYCIELLQQVYPITLAEARRETGPDLLSVFMSSYPDIESSAVANAEMNRARGEAALIEQLHSDAIIFFNKAIMASPSDPSLFVKRASAYSRLDEFHEAINDCEIAVALDPNCFEAYANLGSIYFFMRQWSESVRSYENAVRLNPNNVNYRRKLDEAKGRYTESFYEYSDASEVSSAASLPALPAQAQAQLDEQAAPVRRNRRGQIVNDDVQPELGNDDDEGGGDI